MMDDMTEARVIDIDLPGDDELPGIPDPDDCARRPNVDGTAVIMGDGRTWLLAPYIPALGGAWNRLYDGNVLQSAYQPEDVRLGASHLLQENYDLNPLAVATLIVGANLDDLVKAVETALFGPVDGVDTYSDWVIGSLYANGIDPESIPPARLRTVLDFLVECHRTIPPEKFISSAVAAPKYRDFRTKLAIAGKDKLAREAAAALAMAQPEAEANPPAPPSADPSPPEPAP